MYSFIRMVISSNFLIPVGLIIFVFIWIGLFTFPYSLRGDGWTHSIVVNEIAKTENLVPHWPYTLVENINENMKFSPIPYSELFYISSLPFFYILGDIKGLVIIPSFFSALTAIFTYLLLRKINKYVALTGSLFIILINITRITVVVPSMENIILFTAIVSLYFYYNFIKSQKFSYLILSAFFIGYTAVLKQSGLIFAFSIIMHFTLITIYRLFKTKQLIHIKTYSLITLFIAVIMIGPINEQISRNGTIDFVPANTINKIPFLSAKYIIDPQAYSSLTKWIGPNYWPKQIFPEIIENYIVLLLSQRKIIDSFTMINVLFISTLFVIGSFYLFKHHLDLFVILLTIIIIDIASTYFTQTLINAYHVVGLGVLSLFIPFGILFILKNNNSLGIPKLNTYIAVFVSTILMCILSYNNINNFSLMTIQNFRSNEIQTQKNINSYKNLALFLNQYEIPYNTVFLAYSPILKLYANKNLIWINQLSDLRFTNIFNSTSESETLYWLKRNSINYLILENSQINKKGTSIYIPNTGLLNNIDNYKTFEKIFDDNNIRMWRINYNQNI